MSTTSAARPYRSHKIPACTTCRKRKIRCHTTTAGRACRFCQERGVSCELEKRVKVQTVGGTEQRLRTPSSGPSAKRRRVHMAEFDPAAVSGNNDLSNFPNVTGASPEESSVLMNPTMAEDIEAVEKYITSQHSEANDKARPYSLIPNGNAGPVVYLSVLRRRHGLALAREPGKAQREIMEQILAPHLNEVIRLYFTKLHPCFPVVDERTFNELWRRDRSRISSPLLCAIYASALIFWPSSPVLKAIPQPDMTFAWNQHILALHDDFLAPTISTVHAALLDMIGRPVLGIQGNIIDVGRTVALAQSLGLHRDFGLERGRREEMGVRGRLWWGVVVHDTWSSIAHGTPPLIREGFSDIPLPGVGKERQNGIKSEDTFVHLCRLTHILGQVLPLVYILGPGKDDARVLRRLECDLDQWESDLPSSFQCKPGNGSMACNGASNLHFCRLSVRLLLSRLFLRDVVSSENDRPQEAKPYYQSAVREAASNVIDFVTSLSESQLGEFWLPYVSHLLVSATTILLRCTIECSTAVVRRTCIERLQTFFSHLTWAKHTCSWDIGDFTLDRCKEPFDRIAAAFGRAHADESSILQEPLMRGIQTTSESEALPAVSHVGPVTAGFDDSNNMDDFDIPWDIWEFLDQPLFEGLGS